MRDYTFYFIFSILLICCYSCVQDQHLTDETPPNIIVIFTDDHAKNATSIYGSDLIQTTNIDRIGKEGIVFTNSFVTNSICGPSRAVLLTGKYSHINGFKDNHDQFDTSQETFPKLLQRNGYETSIVGKWHLKNKPTGFDYWNILIGQGHYYNPTFVNNGDTLDYEGYVTDITTDLALDVLENRDQNKPFCLFYHHKAPHRNWMPDSKHFDEFADKDIPFPETFYDDYSSRTSAAHLQDMEVVNMNLSNDFKLQPQHYESHTGTGGMATFNAEVGWAGNYNRMNAEQKAAWDERYDPIGESFKEAKLSGEALDKWKITRYLRDYLACVKSVDNNIGRVLDYLDKNELTENTIVIYTSDQGFYLGEHGWYDKRFMYEESFGTPHVMRYPKKIKAGQLSDEFVVNIDHAATLLDYAGIEVPAEIQGTSIRPLCEASTPDNWRQSVYYHYYQSTGWHTVKKHYGVRTNRYKLINYYEDNEWELYDLDTDPNELSNEYANADYAQIVLDMKLELRRLQQEYKDDSFL